MDDDLMNSSSYRLIIVYAQSFANLRCTWTKGLSISFSKSGVRRFRISNLRVSSHSVKESALLHMSRSYGTFKNSASILE